jgi:hypothetical protein
VRDGCSSSSASDALHLPYLSFWKTLLQATPEERAHALACNALHMIAVTQLFALCLQWVAGRDWAPVAAGLTLAILAATPFVWASDLSRRLPLALGAYLDAQPAPSAFPAFPFSAFVLTGTVAGAALGRQEAHTRARRATFWAAPSSPPARSCRSPFADGSTSGARRPAMPSSGSAASCCCSSRRRPRPGAAGGPSRPRALIGHQTVLVYVLHLQLLYGGVLWPAPLPP